MAPSEDFTPRSDDFDDDDRPRRAPRRSRDRDDYNDDYDDRPRRRRRDYNDGPTGTSALAIVSLILALGSFILCFFSGVPAFFLGVWALISIKQSQGRLGGAGMAWTGVVIGGLNLALLAFGIVAYFVGAPQAKQERQAEMDMKQTGIAMHAYHDANQGFPPPYLATKEGKAGLSWRVAILPYIEQDALYKQFKLDEPWDSPHNIKLLDKMPAVYRSPKDPEGTTDTPYRVFVGNGAFMEKPMPGTDQKPRGTRIVEIFDGTSNTIMVVECSTKVPWTKPDEIEYAPEKSLPQFGYVSNDWFLVLMADGSVQRVPRNEPSEFIRQAITRNGGEASEFNSGPRPRRR